MKSIFPTSCKCNDETFSKYALPAAIHGMDGIFYKKCCVYCAAKLTMEKGFNPVWETETDEYGSVTNISIKKEVIADLNAKKGFTTFWKITTFKEAQETFSNFKWVHRPQLRSYLFTPYLIFSNGKVLRTRVNPYDAIPLKEDLPFGLFISGHDDLLKREAQEYQLTLAIGTFLSNHYSVTEEDRYRAFTFIQNFLFKTNRDYWTTVKNA